MKKVSLSLDALAVETFETVPVTPERGTVQAAQDCYTASCGGTCGAYPDSTLQKAAWTRTVCAQCCV
jgi:hypothetical protein